MGIPLFKFAAEQTGGRLNIESRHFEAHPDDHGTEISATFCKTHIDFTPLGDIISTITTLIQGHPDVDFVYPMHLNPNVRKPISEIFGIDVKNKNHDNQFSPNTFFIEPLDYLNFVFLMEKAHIVLTDSGGIQEEAPSLGKPVLVMRNNTERPEALDAGTVKLVGTDYEKIVNEVSELLDNESYYNMMSHAVNPYGDGLACERIVDYMKNI